MIFAGNALALVVTIGDIRPDERDSFDNKKQFVAALKRGRLPRQHSHGASHSRPRRCIAARSDRPAFAARKRLARW